MYALFQESHGKSNVKGNLNGKNVACEYSLVAHCNTECHLEPGLTRIHQLRAPAACLQADTTKVVSSRVLSALGNMDEGQRVS